MPLERYRNGFSPKSCLIKNMINNKKILIIIIITIIMIIIIAIKSYIIMKDKDIDNGDENNAQNKDNRNY